MTSDLPEQAPTRHTARRAVAAAVWLRSLEYRHLAGTRWLGPTLAGAYLTAVVCLLAGAAWVHHVRPLTMPLGALLVPLWLLWALLPAVGGGGGDLEAAATLAPYPVPAAFWLTSGWVAALADLQYLLPVPGFLAAVVAAHGPVALMPAIAFTAGASALGQLLAWLSLSGLRPGRGQSLFGTATAAVALAGLYLIAGAGGSQTVALLPTGWLNSSLDALDALQGSSGISASSARALVEVVVLTVALAVPVVVLVIAGPHLVRRAMVARAAGARRDHADHHPMADEDAHDAPLSGRRPGPLRRLPRSVWAAMYVSGLRGVGRSLAFKAIMLTSIAVPFVAAAAFPSLSMNGLATLTALSAGASLVANTWAFDAGGTVNMLSAPVSRGRLLSVRAAVAATTLVVVSAVVALGGVVAGLPGLGWATVAYAAFLTVATCALGVRCATVHPAAADLDSLRGRPTSPTAGLSYTFQAGLFSSAYALLWSAGSTGCWWAVAAAATTSAGALTWSRYALRDNARLLAAFAGIR